jgi:hypothetical protein
VSICDREVFYGRKASQNSAFSQKKTAEPLGRTSTGANGNQISGSFAPDFQGSDN